MKKINGIKNVKRDIVIIGAGPAGLSLACSLADTNLKITVIEKQSVKHLSSPSYDGREIALTHRSIKILKKIGKKKEPKIFEEKTEENTKEEPLILTEEVVEEEAPKAKIENSEPEPNTENQILSPAVRKIVVENKIDISSVITLFFILVDNCF